jgi:lipid-A-disaccharide synthase
VVPELLQADVNPASLASEAEAILEDEDRRRRMCEALARVRSGLGPGGAARKAAEIAVSLVTP